MSKTSVVILITGKRIYHRFFAAILKVILPSCKIKRSGISVDKPSCFFVYTHLLTL